MSRAHPRNKFSLEEDNKLKELIRIHGPNNWNLISNLIGTRTPRQCKERWINYLDPNLNTDVWTPEEDRLIIAKFNELGPRWVRIASIFHHRTDTMIKNRYQLLKRKKQREEEISTGVRKPGKNKNQKKAKQTSLVTPKLEDGEKKQLDMFESMLEMDNSTENLLFKEQGDLDFENFFAFNLF